MRREDVGGFVYAHAGASLPTHRISSNLQGILVSASKRGSCWSSANDMKVRVTRLGQLSSSSPDFVVVCEPHENLSLPSLQGYLLVDSEERAAELSRRTSNGGQVETVEGGVRRPRLGVESKLDEGAEWSTASLHLTK